MKKRIVVVLELIGQHPKEIEWVPPKVIVEDTPRGVEVVTINSRDEDRVIATIPGVRIKFTH